MAVDSTPSQVATSALQAIPFGSIIGGPLKACIEAQAMAAQTSWKFIQEVGLNTKENGDKEAVNVTFQFVKDGRMAQLIAATCTEAGSESRHCARCSATTDVAPIVAHGHSFTDYISNGDATTEADGTKTAVCDHGCGETDTVTDEGSRIVETPTGITNVESGHSHKAVKVIENGRVVIIRDGVRYDITGRRL